MNKPTFAKDGYEIYEGYRIKVEQTETGKIFKASLGKKSGKYLRKQDKKLQVVRNWIHEKRIEIERKGYASLNFTDQQKTDAVEALNLLKEFGANLRTAANFYAKHHKKVDHDNGVEHLIIRYLKEQAQRVENGTLRPRTYEDTVKRLKPLREELGNRAIDVVDAEDIKQLLSGYKPQNAANYKRYTSMFFRWAVKKDLVQGNPVEKLDAIKLEDDAPEIYSPNQVKAIIKACTEKKDNREPRKEMLPYFALAFFAGIRPEEICRLEWKDITLDEGIIHIRAAVSKTKKARFLEMPANLRQWLAICPDREGLVFPWSESSQKRWRAEVYKTASVPSIQDGARHSMATYYLALHTIEETTELLGHSDKVLFRHYKGLIKGRKKQAEKYFSIIPGKGKVITMAKAKVA
ncbi:MAG: site-specific integrase [Deltaproteobacteria bacterium]|nr:site-specific integrase [Deltaproteobacteria bacterium]